MKESKLSICQNFEYFEFQYKRSPELYDRASVFLSLSTLEGGPLPAIEALMSGCSAVLTDTGFSQDLAKLFPNVKTVPIFTTVDVVRQKMNEALSSIAPTKQIIQTVSHDNFIGKFQYDQ